LFSFSLQAQILPPEIRHKTLYKFEIFEEGIYEIDLSSIKKTGLNPLEVDPNYLHIYAAWNKQEVFFANVNEFLVELPTNVIGGGDGVFNDTDKVVFYAAGPHKLGADFKNKAYTLTKNPYSKCASFYLVYDKSRLGKKVATEKITSNSESKIFDTVQTFIHRELDKRNLINSGKTWLGERIADASCETFNILLPNALLGEAKVLLSVASQARQQAHLKVTATDFQDTIKFNALEEGTYSSKAILAQKCLNVPIVKESLDLDLFFEKAAGAVAYLDYITCTFNQKLEWKQSPIFFSSFETIKQTKATFQVDNSNEGLRIWNITDRENPLEYALQNQEKYSYFSYTPEGKLHRFVLFDITQKQLSPQYVEAKQLHHLFETSPADLLIITHPILRQAAARLAAFRKQHDNLVAQVVNVTDLYDAFGSGEVSPFAIQKYISWFYNQQGGNKLKYVLFFGDSSYDYLNNLMDEVPDKTFIPSFQTTESFHPLNSYVTDDLYGMLSLPANESALQKATMQLAVGRIPATNLNEAQAIVSKLLHYSNSMGDWQQQLLFIADDGDFNIHQSQADQLAKLVEEELPYLLPKRLFIDAFPQEKIGNVTYASEAKAQLNTAIDRGVAIINFTGHGSESGWTAERLLRQGDVKEWKNTDKFPILFTATCEYGAFDNPQLQSGGEEALLQTAGGAIAVLSATRSAVSGSNFEMNRKFYKVLKKKASNRLGDLLRETKNAVTSSVVKRHFTLLGDPSMPLGIPKPEIQVDSLNSFTDKEGVSQLYLSGKINPTIQPEFNGKILLEMYAPPEPFKTFGEEQEKWQAVYYNQDDYLIRGKANVINSHFEIITNISQGMGIEHDNLKVSLFAYDEVKGRSYSQAITNLSSVKATIKDNIDITPPKIQLSIANDIDGNSEFSTGNNWLIAKITDASNIMLNRSTEGHQLIATINSDTTHTFFLGDYFYTNLENPTEAYIQFPLANFKIPSGNYSITLSASDIWQNRGSANIALIHDAKEVFNLVNVSVFPNPVKENANISILVNKPAEEVQYQLVFYNTNGQKIFELAGNMIEGERVLTINSRLLAVDKSQLIFGKLTLKKNSTTETQLHTFKLMIDR
ncbi:MAG: type IX secretion system sortase PorU, partial [Bacteroidota bacterium]